MYLGGIIVGFVFFSYLKEKRHRVFLADCHAHLKNQNGTDIFQKKMLFHLVSSSKLQAILQKSRPAKFFALQIFFSWPRLNVRITSCQVENFSKRQGCVQ
jgi:hypothetical protein